MRGPSGAAPAAAGADRSLPGLARRWVDVTLHPSVAAFSDQLPSASWRVVWLGLALLGAIEGAALAVVAGRPGALGKSGLPAGLAAALASDPLATAALGFSGTFASSFILFGLLQLSARAMGGRGSFLALAYAVSLFWVPLIAIAGVATAIPVVGGAISVLARLYAFYLCAPAVAAAHRLPPGRVWIAVLILVAAGIALGATVLLTTGLRPLAP